LKYTFFHRHDFPPSYLHDQEPPETRAFSGDIPFVPVSPLLNAGSSTHIFLFFSTNWETCLLGTIHSTRYYPHSTLHWGPSCYVNSSAPTKEPIYDLKETGIACEIFRHTTKHPTQFLVDSILEWLNQQLSNSKMLSCSPPSPSPLKTSDAANTKPLLTACCNIVPAATIS
jgi:hypothetical protein